MLEDYQGALENFDKAHALEPNNASILSSRGDAKRLLEDYERALEDLGKANIVEPNDALTLDIQIGVNKLKECTISTMGSSSIHVHQKDHEIMPPILSNQTNVASTSGFLSSNTDAMVTSFHQTLNFITKYLKISCLDKVYHQVNGGIHEDVHAKQLLESHGQHNPRGIIVTSRIQAPEQRVQFLFENTHAMTSVVGVGLDYAQVYWTQNNEILVEAIGENEWGQLWQEAFTIGSLFHEPILMYMPSDVNDVESLSSQTVEEICWDEIFGTISSCGEVFLLELVTTFFMTRKVIEDYEIPMTIQDSSSTRPNAIDNIGWEGKSDCDSIKKFTIGGTQHPNNLLGLLWNIFSSGGTHVGGVLDCIVGHEDDGQGALSQNGGIDGGGDNNTHGDGGVSANNGHIDICDNNFQGGGRVNVSGRGVDGGGDNNTHGDGGANASSGWIDICDNFFQGGGRVVNVGSDNNTHQGGGRVNASGRGVDVGGDNNAQGDEKVDVGGDNVTHGGGGANGGGDNYAQGDGKVDVGGDNVTHGGGGANGGGDNDAQGDGKVDVGGDNVTHGGGGANGGGDNDAQGDGKVDVGGDNVTHGGGGANGGGDNDAQGDGKVDVGGDNVTHGGGGANGGGDNDAQGDGKVDVGGDNVTHGGGRLNGGGDNVTHGGGGLNGGGDNDAQGGGKVDVSGNNNAPGNGRPNGGGGVGSRSGEMHLEGVGDLVENHHDEYQGALSQNDKGANVGGDNNTQGSGNSCGGFGGGSNGDDNNAKDSEGNGGDNNAHGNDNNGDGVGGHNGNDGNERGDDGGGDNNECNGRDGDTDGHLTKEAQNAIVKVQPDNLKYHWNVRKMVVLNFMEMGCLNKKKNHKKEFGWKICNQIQGIFNME
ncbi:unnamed protein product [Sphagnum troendelagicum]